MAPESPCWGWKKKGINYFVEEGLMVWGRAANLPRDTHIEKGQLGKYIQIITSAK